MPSSRSSGQASPPDESDFSRSYVAVVAVEVIVVLALYWLGVHFR